MREYTQLSLVSQLAAVNLYLDKGGPSIAPKIVCTNVILFDELLVPTWRGMGTLLHGVPAIVLLPINTERVLLKD